MNLLYTAATEMGPQFTRGQWVWPVCWVRRRCAGQSVRWYTDRWSWNHFFLCSSDFFYILHLWWWVIADWRRPPLTHKSSVLFIYVFWPSLFVLIFPSRLTENMRRLSEYSKTHAIEEIMQRPSCKGVMKRHSLIGNGMLRCYDAEVN